VSSLRSQTLILINPNSDSRYSHQNKAHHLHILRDQEARAAAQEELSHEGGWELLHGHHDMIVDKNDEFLVLAKDEDLVMDLGFMDSQFPFTDLGEVAKEGGRVIAKSITEMVSPHHSSKEASDIRNSGEASDIRNSDATWLPHMSTDEMAKRRDISAQGSKIICIVGWAEDVVELIQRFDKSLNAASEMFILTDRPKEFCDADFFQAGIVPTVEEEEEKADTGLKFVKKLRVIHGSVTRRDMLERLPLDRTDVVLVIADDLEEEEPAVSSDSKCITSVVHIDKIRSEMGLDKCHIICECLGIRTKKVIETNRRLSSKATFFHSNELECGIFISATENPFTTKVICELVYNQAGVNIVNYDVSIFFKEGEDTRHPELSWYDLQTRASMRQQVLIGFKRFVRGNASESEPLVMNPTPEEKFVPIEWQSGDLVMVLEYSTAE